MFYTVSYPRVLKFISINFFLFLYVHVYAVCVWWGETKCRSEVSYLTEMASEKLCCSFHRPCLLAYHARAGL